MHGTFWQLLTELCYFLFQHLVTLERTSSTQPPSTHFPHTTSFTLRAHLFPHPTQPTFPLALFCLRATPPPPPNVNSWPIESKQDVCCIALIGQIYF